MYNSRIISEMAAPMGESKAKKLLVCCLNALTLLNIRNIASEDVLNELMNDYFVTFFINVPQLQNVLQHCSHGGRRCGAQFPYRGCWSEWSLL